MKRWSVWGGLNINLFNKSVFLIDEKKD